MQVFTSEQKGIPVDNRTVSVASAFNANIDRRVSIPRAFIQVMLRYDQELQLNSRNLLFPYCVMLSNARFRKEKRSKRVNPVVVIKKSAYRSFFGAHSTAAKADRYLDALQEKGLIRVVDANKETKAVYLTGMSCFAGNDSALATERHAIANQSGYFVLPRKIYETHFENAAAWGSGDIALDLWFHCVYNDEKFPLSCAAYPIAVYDNVADHRPGSVQGTGVTSARALAMRLHVDQRTISRTLKALEEMHLIVRHEIILEGKRGTIIAFAGYFEMMYGFRAETAACMQARESKMTQFYYWKDALGYGRAKRLRSSQLNRIWNKVKYRNLLLESKEHESSLLALGDIDKREISEFSERLDTAVSPSQNTGA